MKANRQSTGRIAERIVANELEFQGFTVRDLNLEGQAANADLAALKDGNLCLIQVKGCRYGENYNGEDGWWYHYGFCKEGHILSSDTRIFNQIAGSFQAGVAALVCFRSPSDYRLILAPVRVAENAAQINLNYAYRTKKNGRNKRPGMVWVSACIPKTSEWKKAMMVEEWGMLKRYLIDRSRPERDSKEIRNALLATDAVDIVRAFEDANSSAASSR